MNLVPVVVLFLYMQVGQRLSSLFQQELFARFLVPNMCVGRSWVSGRNVFVLVRLGRLCLRGRALVMQLIELEEEHV